jgi:hypothetical protein
MNRKPKQKGHIKSATAIFLLLGTVLLFSISIIRGQCINKAYELSALDKYMGQRRMDYEQIESERLRDFNKERLFVLAGERGFVLMQEGRTYNVGR